MNEITISKTLWMNAVARKLNPRSKTVAVVDYWYDRDGSVNLKYHLLFANFRPFDQYSNDHLTTERVASILGYKSVKFNRNYSITVTE